MISRLHNGCVRSRGLMRGLAGVKSTQNVLFGEDAIQQLKVGVDCIHNAVASTLGPRGRNVLIDTEYFPRVTKDGYTVAQNLTLSDRFPNMAVSLIKQAALKTNTEAGDGTTTATILACSIFNEAQKRISSGCHPVELRRGIERAVAVAEKVLNDLKRPLSKEHTETIAYISCGDDPSLTALLMEAFDAVGPDGVVHVERGNEFKVDVAEGFIYPSGPLPHVLHNSATVSVDKALIVATGDPINRVDEIVPLLQKLHSTKKSCLLIAPDFADDVKTTLLVNRVRGTVDVIPVKAVGYGSKQVLQLEDLCSATGAMLISRADDGSLESLKDEHFGLVERAIISPSQIALTPSSNEDIASAVTERVQELQKELETTEMEYDKTLIQMRLGRLRGCTATITVGGLSDVDVDEKKDRLVDAVHAVHVASKEGVVPGGGATLLLAAQKVRDELGKARTFDERGGMEAVESALRQPIMRLCKNANIDAGLIMQRITAAVTPGDVVYDAENGVFGNPYEIGVLDPVAVELAALRNAASVSGTLVTASTIISKPQNNEE
ncbi:hypothetical protein PCE1_004076 [Barthelona sp. PCE]